MKYMKLKIRKNKIKQDLKYETNGHMVFKKSETIRSFSNSIYNGKISIDEAEMKQTNLYKNIVDFSNKSRPR